MYWWLPSAVSAIGGAASYAYKRRKRTPDFSATAYGKMLRKEAVEGKYSPRTKGIMLGKVGRELGTVEQRRKAETRGELTRLGAGAERSIAGIKVLGAPGRETARGMRETATGIELEQEESKRRAREEFAMRQYQHKEMRRAEAREDVSGLITGITGAVGAGVSAKFQMEQLKIEQAQKTRQLDIEEEYKTKMGQYYTNMGLASIARATQQGFVIPGDFSQMTHPEIVKFAIENKLNSDEVEKLWYIMRAENE